LRFDNSESRLSHLIRSAKRSGKEGQLANLARTSARCDAMRERESEEVFGLRDECTSRDSKESECIRDDIGNYLHRIASS